MTPIVRVLKGVQFTSLQSDVCDLITEGVTGKNIARALRLDPKEVEFHRRWLFKKFRVKNSVQLTRVVLMAERDMDTPWPLRDISEPLSSSTGDELGF
jgi:DNA-binding CsgD family transcriptional regulator